MKGSFRAFCSPLLDFYKTLTPSKSTLAISSVLSEFYITLAAWHGASTVSGGASAEAGVPANVDVSTVVGIHAVAGLPSDVDYGCCYSLSCSPADCCQCSSCEVLQTPADFASDPLNIAGFLYCCCCHLRC
jgi:hypothetical protein